MAWSSWYVSPSQLVNNVCSSTVSLGGGGRRLRTQQVPSVIALWVLTLKSHAPNNLSGRWVQEFSRLGATKTTLLTGSQVAADHPRHWSQWQSSKQPLWNNSYLRNVEPRFAPRLKEWNREVSDMDNWNVQPIEMELCLPHPYSNDVYNKSSI